MIKSILKIKNYKSIKDEFIGFDAIYPMNIIIGKNNSGKSTLLDIVELFINKENNTYEFLTSQVLEDDDIISEFYKGHYTIGLSSMDDYHYARRFINKELVFSVFKKTRTFTSINEHIENQKIEERLKNLTFYFDVKISRKQFKRIRAERFIKKEFQNKQLNLQSDGTGATNFIQEYINEIKYNRQLIVYTLLEELNKIANPDMVFQDIIVRKDNELWEVYLKEENKGYISLSNSGSGLQTLILILINLFVIPNHENKKISEYFFLFEELENNLHPSILRRLLNYLYNIAIKEEVYFFITTHSNVVIDLFSSNKNAQLIHVRNDGEKTSVINANNTKQFLSILDDLDFRASDILQSNFLLWVEGPSDRIYINHWLKEKSPELLENLHYTIMFYGGKLLSHLTVDDEALDNFIKVSKINRNTGIIIDSDKKKKSDEINKTKQRIKSEFEKEYYFVWVTEGKEIENYISMDIINQIKPKFDLNNEIKNNQFASIPKQIFKDKTIDKIKLAKEVIQYQPDWSVLDLDSKVQSLIDSIKKANKI